MNAKTKALSGGGKKASEYFSLQNRVKRAAGKAPEHPAIVKYRKEHTKNFNEGNYSANDSVRKKIINAYK